MELSFDEYWENLVRKIYSQSKNKESLENIPPNDLIFYRLTCIRGETMVDGIQSYFERRYDEFENDMNLLKEIGFWDIVEIFYAAKKNIVWRTGIK